MVFMKNNNLVWLIFGFIFILKFLQCYYLFNIVAVSNPEIESKYFTYLSGDSYSYIQPFENLYLHNEYYSLNSENEKIFAGRMPVYGVFYYLLRFFIEDINIIYFIQVIFQILFETVAIICLAKICQNYIKSKLVIIFSLIFSSLCVYWTNYSLTISPESIGLSLCVIAYYFYLKYITYLNLNYIAICSFLITLLIGLKPYMIVFLALISIDLLYKIVIRKVINFRPIVILAFIPIAIWGTWGIRNYIKIGKVYFLTEPYSGYTMCKKITYIKFREFISLLGHSDEFWEQSALSSFFFKYKVTNYCINDIPTCKGFNKDSVLILKDIMSANISNLSKKQDFLNGIRIQRYIYAFENQNPNLRLLSGFKLIPKFLINSGSYYIPYTENRDVNGVLQLLFKISQSVFYYLFLTFGSIGLAILFFQKKELVVTTMPFLLIFLFCFIVKGIELRYLLYSYPFFHVGLIYFIFVFYKLKKILWLGKS